MSSLEDGVLGAGEGLAERMERLQRRLSEISQRWDNRLILNKVVIPEEYINGRLTIVGEIAFGAANFHKLAYAAVDFYPAHSEIPQLAAVHDDVWDVGDS